MSIKLMQEVYEGVVLPSTEKALLAFLAFRAHDDGTSIFPGVEAMMQAICLKKWQTQKLLRSLREKGYLLQVTHGGGARHYVSYRIPVDITGSIVPCPMSPEQIAEQRAKYTRKKKKPDQAQPAGGDDAFLDLADDLADDDQAPGAPAPAPAPAVREQQGQQQRFPAVAAAISTALVPVPAPIPITPPPVLTPEEQEQRELQEQIEAWTKEINYYQLNRDAQKPGSRSYMRWDRLLQGAQEALNEWKQAAAQICTTLSIVEPITPSGEYA